MHHKYNCIDALRAAGIEYDDAIALRRISMTLHRWHELECGNSNDFRSECIVRGHKLSKADFQYDDNGKSYLEVHYHDQNGARYFPVADRERGALKRLAKIMAKYPQFNSYVQGDPRGASLYIGENLTDSNYSRGIAVYK